MKLKLLWFKYRIIHFLSKFISYFKNMSLTEEKFLKCLDKYLEKYVEKFEDYQLSTGNLKMINKSNHQYKIQYHLKYKNLKEFDMYILSSLNDNSLEIKFGFPGIYDRSFIKHIDSFLEYLENLPINDVNKCIKLLKK